MLEKHKYNIYPEIIGEDYEDLKESISKGYDKSFPIILFEDKVLDGWNRYKICLELGISPPTKNFEGTKEEALQFVIRTNNRRHLTTSQRAAIALEYLPLFEAAAKQRQGTRTDIVAMWPQSSNADPVANWPQQKLEANLPQAIKSREEAAAIMGVGSRSVQRAKFVKENSPELFEKILKGEETVNKAEKEIKKKEREEEIQKQKEDIEKGRVELPKGKFEVIVIDPPWKYGTIYDPNGRRVSSPYPEMSQEELLKLNIPSSDNSMLFLWTTHRFIWDAKELLDNWGFVYRNILVWDKEIIGMGDLFRMQCEFCLVGIKGKPILVNNHTYRDIIKEQRREHSRKPEKLYEIINELCVGRKLDFFSRQHREGWEVIGNDIGKFVAK